MTTVVLVDQHPLARRGLRTMLAADAAIDVVGEAGSADEARTLLQALHPDVVVLDLLDQPEKPGLSLTRDIKQTEPAPAVLVVTAAPEQDMLLPALEAGADGFCNKDRPAQEYVTAVHRVAEQRAYLCACAQRQITRIVRGGALTRVQLGSLTADERAVLSGIAGGYTTGEIAAQLASSPGRVERLHRQVKHKLRAQHRSELVDFALRAGLLRPSRLDAEADAAFQGQ